MATTPRYVGASASAALAYVIATAGAEYVLQVFDQDGDGAVATATSDEASFVRAVCAAETEIDEALAASHATPFTGTVPDSIREIAAMRCFWCAVRFRPKFNRDPDSPYRLLYNDTTARLKRLAADGGARIPEHGPPVTVPTATDTDIRAPFWGEGNDPSRGWSGF